MRLAALLLLTCCDAGRPQPVETPPAPSPHHTVPRSSIHLDEHTIGGIPVSGIAVVTSGMDGYVDWDMVDYAKRTLTVRVDEHGEHREQVVVFDAETIRHLTALADLASRETPHGDVPHALDIMQALYIADHDEVFELHGEPIGDVTDHTGRPDASALVLAVQKLEPPPPRHPHAIARSALGLADLDLPAKDLPKHGVVFKAWGLGGDFTLVVDRDASTVRQISNRMGQKHADVTRKLDAAKVDVVMTAADAAWAETPQGEMPTATDVREDMYIFDDDEAFYLSGHPIGAYGTQGRPLAQAAKQAVYLLVR